MQPSHLCASCCCRTRNLPPLSVCKKDGGCTSEVKIIVFLCLVATRCSAICVPDRPIKPLLLQLFVQIEGYHQRSVGPVKMPCYRQGQNHISVFPHFVSKLTFPIAIHCKTNAGSTHILVALRRGWEKDCCCYVHLALRPTGWNKSIAKSKSDGQIRHDHVTQATMHSSSPCQKFLKNLDLQSTLAKISTNYSR